MNQDDISTIVRLPIYMREGNRGLFVPRVVSIGPYHRGNQSTLDMEAHKEHVFQAFLRRLGGVNPEYIEDATAHWIARAHRCYSGNVNDYTGEMLLRDGCFVIEILLRWKEETTNDDNLVRLMSDSIYYDLLLVDNQIPFFVLTKLFNIYVDCTGNINTQLLHLVKDFFNHKDQFSWANLERLDLPDNPNQVLHLLDLQYKLVIGNNIENNIAELRVVIGCPICLCGNICPTSSMPRGIPGANELHDYGVMFRANAEQGTKMFDVTFQCKTMKIPRFEINFGSKILLANLFAYDQIMASQIAAGQQGDHQIVGAVTSYVVLMNALINTKKDVVVLQREGILDNLLSNEEEVATFFNKLGRCALVDVREHRYTAMFNDVNRYWRSTLNCCKYLVIFRTMHFKNPWTCLSLLGAIMLIGFSCTSMVFAILKYKHR